MQNNLKFASFAYRLLAFMIDLIILSIIAKIIFYVFGLRGALVLREFVPSFASPSAIVAMLILWIYNVAMARLYGATIGKMAFGLQVINTSDVSASTSEEKELAKGLDWSTVILRETIGKLISTLPAGLGFLWIAWDRKKQAFHDKIAETVVVKN